MAEALQILVSGGTGQVGLALQRHDWPTGVTVHAPGRAELDLADLNSIRRMVRSRRWDAVINCAAYTAVDKAETDVEAAWRINALGPAILAQETGGAGIPLVHVSTDYVFDGRATRPYREDDPVAPLGVYGASKEAGEQAVRSGNPRHAIARTAWVFGPDRANFLKTMLRLAAERPVLRVVDDQRGSPTATRDLAAGLAVIALRLASDPAAPNGTFHLANAGETSWCGFAREIMRQSAELSGPSVPVEPIATSDYPTPARRPASSVLDISGIGSAYGITLPPWQDGVAAALHALIARGDGLDAKPDRAGVGA